MNANDSVATTKKNIVAELRSKFGKGNDGVYTAAQIMAAVNALDQSDPSDAAVVGLVATDMEKGAPTGGLGVSNRRSGAYR